MAEGRTTNNRMFNGNMGKINNSTVRLFISVDKCFTIWIISTRHTQKFAVEAFRGSHMSVRCLKPSKNPCILHHGSKWEQLYQMWWVLQIKNSLVGMPPAPYLQFHPPPPCFLFSLFFGASWQTSLEVHYCHKLSLSCHVRTWYAVLLPKSAAHTCIWKITRESQNHVITWEKLLKWKWYCQISTGGCISINLSTS